MFRKCHMTVVLASTWRKTGLVLRRNFFNVKSFDFSQFGDGLFFWIPH